MNNELIVSNNVIETLVEREKKKRKSMKISQAKLAEESGVSYASIRRFEEKGEIALTSLIKIAEVLDCLDDFNMLFKMMAHKSLEEL